MSRSRQITSGTSDDARPRPTDTVRVIGYASYASDGDAGTRELKQQAGLIARECQLRYLRLTEVVGNAARRTGRPSVARVELRA